MLPWSFNRKGINSKLFTGINVIFTLEIHRSALKDYNELPIQKFTQRENNSSAFIYWLTVLFLLPPLWRGVKELPPLIPDAVQEKPAYWKPVPVTGATSINEEQGCQASST